MGLFKRTLSDIQRYTLYFFADMYGGGLYEKKYQDEKSENETIQILRDYQKDLELSDLEVQYIISPDFNIRLSDLFVYLRNIKDSSIIDSFLYTCIILVDINYTDSSGRDFFRMMKELGYNEDEAKEKIRSISFKYDKHFFDIEELPINIHLEQPTVIKSWPLLTFAKAHGKMQVGEFVNKETGELFKSCIFTKPDGTRTFVAFSATMGELNPKEIAAMKDELVVVQLESGNYSLCKRKTNWEDVDLGVKADDDRYSHSWSLSDYCRKNNIIKIGMVNIAGKLVYELTSKNNNIAYAEISKKIKERKIQDKIIFDWTSCASIITYTSFWYDDPCFNYVRIGLLVEPHGDIHYLVYEDEKLKDEWKKITKCNGLQNNCGIVRQRIASSNNEEKNTKKIVKEKKSSMRVNSKNREKEQHNATLQYVAVSVDVLLVLCLGFSIYYSDTIRLEQDRMLFLCSCIFLAIIAWGYPYFDSSVKFDNDGCFEQGCIHPLIGVFGLLFLPLFIHYWLYKGIIIFIILIKRLLGYKK